MMNLRPRRGLRPGTRQEFHPHCQDRVDPSDKAWRSSFWLDGVES